MRVEQAQHTVFFSYAREDREWVGIVANILAAGGATVFMDVRDLEFGDRWEDVLMQKLKVVHRVLVFWSKNAAKSKWVEREYKTALTNGKRVVPVPIDDTPLSKELSQFHALMDFKRLVMTARKRSVSSSWRRSSGAKKNSDMQKPPRIVLRRPMSLPLGRGSGWKGTQIAGMRQSPGKAPRVGPGAYDIDLGKKAVELVFG